jgi:hypothetical protein
MLTICKSFEPVGEEIFLGRDLDLKNIVFLCQIYNIHIGINKNVHIPDVIDDGILEPG